MTLIPRSETSTVYEDLEANTKAKGNLSLRKDGEIIHQASEWKTGISRLDTWLRLAPAMIGARLTRFSRNEICIHWTKKDGILYMESIRARPGLDFSKFQRIFQELDTIATDMRARMLKTFAINPRLFKILEGNGWYVDDFDAETATEDVCTFSKHVSQS